MDTQELILSYKSFLSKSHAPLTVKNYLADIYHFTRWFARTYDRAFSPDLLSKTVIDSYIQLLHDTNKQDTAALSFASIKRHISSLRSFTAYLYRNELISENPFTIPEPVKQDAWDIKGFKNFLYENNSSDLTIKYYINDINSFITWHSKSVYRNDTSSTPHLTSDMISEYARRLSESLTLAPASINRKLSGIRKYLEYRNTKFEPEFKNVELKPADSVRLEELSIPVENTSYSRIPPVRLIQKMYEPYAAFENTVANTLSQQIVKTRLKKILTSSGRKNEKIDQIIRGLAGKNIKKEFYAPYSISTSSYPLHKKILFHARHTRPEWYKKYHTYPFVHYVHFGVLLLVSTLCALFLYHKALGPASADSYKAQTASSRTFIFKGKLKDKDGNVITTATDVRLSLYDSPTASGSALTWQEVQQGIKPDDQGNITIAIGNKTPIPDSLFQTNTPLYLGVAIGNSEELSPREEIGVPYANNAGSVQGLVPITNSTRQENVLLALDASGKLSIGGDAHPVFQATGGSFTLSGETLLLTTNESSEGNILLSPHGNGKIEFTKALIGTDGNIKIESGVSISATSSAAPALSVNQDSSAPLISASTIGIPRFIVDSQGIITRGIWAGNPIGTEFGGFGASITPKSPGEILYSTSTSTYGHLTAGAAGQCLTANGYDAPLWSSCGFLSQLNGALTMTNNTLDFLLGATSTNSAKFAFTNMNNGTPTFKVGGTLSITSDNLIQADNQDLKVGGNTTKNILLAQAGGNVGIGTTSPSRTLDINGTLGGNVDTYTDGATTQTVTRDTKALVYDLEKDTGAADSSTTTTYNITGLPDQNGTITFIYAKVSKAVTSTARTQTINIQINGVFIASIATNDGVDSLGAETDIKHFTVTRSNGTWHLVGDTGNSNTADLAEWTPYSGIQPVSGAITSIGSDGTLTNAKTAYDPKAAGIITTNPHTTIGGRTSTSVRLALSGRVPAIVTNITGDIKTGDFITTSPLPGFGMRLNQTGSSVGHALETFSGSSTCTEVTSLSEIAWPYDDGTNSAHPCFKIKAGLLDQNIQDSIQAYGLTSVDYIYIGKVMTLVDVSWSNGSDMIASLNDASIETSTSVIDSELASQIQAFEDIEPVVIVGGKAIKTIQAYAGLAVGTIRAGIVLASNITTQNITAATATIADLTAGTIKTTLLVSPLAKVDTIKTNTIETNGSNNLTVSLPATDSALIVKNAETNKEVAKIDASGNASFSGQLTSNNLNTNDATISGTLRTENLIAGNIEGLDSRIGSIAARLALNSKPTPSAPVETFGDTFNTASVSAGFGTFYQGLLSLGASTFGNLSVMDQLSIGTTFTLSQNSINTLGTDLNIQPLRQGAVSFLAGAVRIEADGQLSVSENAVFHKNLTVKGKLFANLISPLADKDVEVTLPSSNNHDSRFVISGASSSAVLTVNNQGDVASSGSATFSKIKFNLVGQAIASSNFTATATGSAGTAVLKGNTTELTIIDPLVTKDSLIYITPANNTNNTVLYLMRQTENTSDGPIGSFTVGVSQPVPTDTLFNWLIVN